MISKLFIDHWKVRYDSDKYWEKPYRDSLSILRSEDLDDYEFKDALIRLLHWKDGKNPEFPSGHHTAKPNTLSRIPTLEGAELQSFKTDFQRFVQKEPIDDRGKSFYLYLTEEQGLWKSLVIPIFVCHCAKPTVVPIIDQHVVRAMNVLQGNFHQVKKETLTWDDYTSYFDWFHQIAFDQGLRSLDELRELDTALWSFGREVKQTLRAKKKRTRAPRTSDSMKGKGVESSPHLDPSFARMCEAYREQGMKQEDAIRKACGDLNVDFSSLPAMYSKYAGRGFAEWRKKRWI